MAWQRTLHGDRVEIRITTESATPAFVVAISAMSPFMPQPERSDRSRVFWCGVARKPEDGPDVTESVVGQGPDWTSRGVLR